MESVHLQLALLIHICPPYLCCTWPGSRNIGPDKAPKQTGAKKTGPDKAPDNQWGLARLKFLEARNIGPARLQDKHGLARLQKHSAFQGSSNTMGPAKAPETLHWA